jgi:hypothetical protein
MVFITESSDGDPHRTSLHRGCQMRGSMKDLENASSTRSRVHLRTSLCATARRRAMVHRARHTGPPLFGGHVDVVTLQAVVELKPGESQEPGGARLVTMCALERIDDGLPLELVQVHGAGSPSRRFALPRWNERFRG